jgi:hypothetical protein
MSISESLAVSITNAIKIFADTFTKVTQTDPTFEAMKDACTL